MISEMIRHLFAYKNTEYSYLLHLKLKLFDKDG